MEARIRQLESMLLDAVIVEDDGTGAVQPGCIVTIVYEGDSTTTPSAISWAPSKSASRGSTSSRPHPRWAKRSSARCRATASPTRPPTERASRSPCCRWSGTGEWLTRGGSSATCPVRRARRRSCSCMGSPRLPTSTGSRRIDLSRSTTEWSRSTTAGTVAASVRAACSVSRTAPTTSSPLPTSSACARSSRSAIRWAVRSPSSSGSGTPIGSTAWCCARRRCDSRRPRAISAWSTRASAGSPSRPGSRRACCNVASSTSSSCAGRHRT